MTLSGVSTPGLIWPGIDDNERAVLHLPKAPAFMKPHHQIVSCHIQETLWRGGCYSNAEMHLMYTTTPANWTILVSYFIRLRIWMREIEAPNTADFESILSAIYIDIYIYIYACVCVCVCEHVCVCELIYLMTFPWAFPIEWYKFVVKTKSCEVFTYFIKGFEHNCASSDNNLKSPVNKGHTIFIKKQLTKTDFSLIFLLLSCVQYIYIYMYIYIYVCVCVCVVCVYFCVLEWVYLWYNETVCLGKTIYTLPHGGWALTWKNLRLPLA